MAKKKYKVNKLGERNFIHPWNPSQEDIARITAEIREGWSDEQRNKRMRIDERTVEFDLNTLHISPNDLERSRDAS